jgi:hypothetical protein
MTVYYKATRPDGLDFWTGTIAYRPGVTVGHPVSRCYADMRPNDPGTYLSVSTEPGEVLTGGSWPCRVFRVDPVDRTVARTDGMYPWKRGCVSVRVLEEVPAYVALGPNGERVAALVERVRRLTAEEATQLAAAVGAAWVAARTAAVDAARDAAWSAAVDAAVALLVRDLILPGQFDLLYAPWATVAEASS